VDANESADAEPGRRRVVGAAAGPDASRADREEFIDWLRESALHVAEMLALRRCTGTGALSALDALEPPKGPMSRKTWSPFLIRPQGRAGRRTPPPSPAPEERGAPGKPPLSGISAPWPGFRSPRPVSLSRTLGCVEFLGSSHPDDRGTERGERPRSGSCRRSVLNVDPEDSPTHPLR